MKRFLTVVLTTLILFNCVGCSKIKKVDPNDKNANTNVSNYPVTVDKLTFKEAPKTVVSLSPALTEILYEIGVGKKLVARSNYCSFPEEVKSLPSAGSPAKPDIEAILKLKPEIVVTQSPIAQLDVNTLETSGIKVLTIAPPKTYYELLDTYARLSLIFLGNNSANDMTTKMTAKLDNALAKAQEKKSTNSFVFIITSDLAVATGDTLSGNILSVFGNNIAKDAKNYTMPVAEIVAAAPTIVFVSNDVDLTKLPPELLALPAFANGKVVKVDYSLFEKPTSRLSTVIQDISTKLGDTAIESQVDSSSLGK